METIIQKIKICKLCGSSDNKFGPHCHQCIKCLSKRKNAKANEKNYFKNYYELNKEKVLLQQREAYHKSKNIISV
jgi:hypothetical protein